MRSIATAGMTGVILGATIMLAVSPPADVGTHAPARSTRWPAFRTAYLKKHPACEVCGSRTDLELHHVRPFHIAPELELDEANVIVLCATPSCKSHLTIGHLGNYQRSNPHIREDAALLKKRRDESP